MRGNPQQVLQPHDVRHQEQQGQTATSRWTEIYYHLVVYFGQWDNWNQLLEEFTSTEDRALQLQFLRGMVCTCVQSDNLNPDDLP